MSTCTCSAEWCVQMSVAVYQMEEIVEKFGLVVISRAGSNPEQFIYDSDVLTKHKVPRLFCFF